MEQALNFFFFTFSIISIKIAINIVPQISTVLLLHHKILISLLSQLLSCQSEKESLTNFTYFSSRYFQANFHSV